MSGHEIRRPVSNPRLGLRPQPWHVLPRHSWQALCGARPAAGIEAWSETTGREVTCPGCRAVAERIGPSCAACGGAGTLGELRILYPQMPIGDHPVDPRVRYSSVTAPCPVCNGSGRRAR